MHLEKKFALLLFFFVHLISVAIKFYVCCKANVAFTNKGV